MNIDPKILKQLTETFQVELEERLQIITENLLFLEKCPSGEKPPNEIMEPLFRAAHNIKGTAQGIGINTVGEIAHHLETLFASLQKGNIAVSCEMTDCCFQAVDCIRDAMNAHVDERPLSFDLKTLLYSLSPDGSTHTDQKILAKIAPVVHRPSTTSTQDSVRIPLTNLDRVSALMEEFQVNRIAIEEHFVELTKLASRFSEFSQLQKSMRSRINELSILSSSLQDEIRMLRLVPANTLMRFFPRQVRDLARETGRNVNFEMSGDDVRLDRLILEGLKDPLIHLLRNAIDHGIEDSDIRKASGKSESGHIRIDIRDEGSQILFMVTDDGAGIDAARVVEIAKQKNLLSENEKIPHHAILELIFKPGFSTKTIITELSGRGVGLDIVKTSLENLKGSVTVTSEKGVGTTFYLRVPLTLTSERGLFVRSSGQLFVIPTTDVERALTLKSTDIIEVEGTQAISENGHPIPLRTLSGILGLPETISKNPGRLPVVVVKKNREPLALLVEEIPFEKEIVIKQLNAPLNSIHAVIGGTLSGSGEVIIVLNTGDIIDVGYKTGEKAARFQWQDEKTKEDKRIPILVVDDSITTRTLEKNILESKNYDVTLATNGQEAWDLLQKQKFSLVVTDVSMPIMDGFSLTERIRQSKAYNDLPVIIVTSLGSPDEKKRGVEVGASAYIVKSEFESGNLLEIVEQLV